MKTNTRNIKLLPCMIAALAMGVAMPASSDEDDDDGLELPFSEARLYFELNDTDGDLGFHGLIDGDDWKRLEIEDPKEEKLLDVLVRGRLRKQGLTEIFFESAEPTFDELAPARFFKRFPEGVYEISGETLEGDELEAEVEVSHVMAAPAGDVEISGVPAADGCDGDLPVIEEGPYSISWSAVTMSHPDIGTPGVAVEVEQYELVAEIEREDAVPETLKFSAVLPSSVTSFELPEDFTDLSEGELKFEIITKLDNGNQTAVESCFLTE